MRENMERFRDLFELAPIAYFLVGKDGLIQMANTAAEEMLGYQRDAIVGRHVFDLYADTRDGKEKARNLFLRFLEGEEIRAEELEM